MHKHSHALVVVLAFLFLAALAVAGHFSQAAAQSEPAPASWPRPQLYVYATKSGNSLEALCAEINALPGDWVPDNPERYWVEDVLSVQTLYLADGNYRLVATLRVMDMGAVTDAVRPGGE